MTCVVAVVVTHNRLALLRECLVAVRARTHPPESVIVVDNASSDGTANAVRDEFPEVHLLALTDNGGASGGFHCGLQEASGTDADWYWLLDDDTITRPDALERLLGAPWREARLPRPALLSSRVDWRNGEPHPMNTPMLRRRDPDQMVRAVEVGLLPLRATTFVSLLVSAEAVRRHGLPRAEYFMQSDDIEFTARILRHGHGYLVPDSVVEHRTKSAHTFLDDPVRFHFHLRNTLLMLRSPAWSRAEKAALVWVVVDSVARFVRRARAPRDAVRVVAHAVGQAAAQMRASR